MALGMNGEETMTYPSSVRTEKKPVSINQTTSLGFVGLGSMGLPIATNMQRSGHEMHLYDVDASKISALTNEKTHIHDSPKWAEEIKRFTPPDSIGQAAMQVFQQSIEEHGLGADLTNIYKTLRKSASLD